MWWDVINNTAEIRHPDALRIFAAVAAEAGSKVGEALKGMWVTLFQIPTSAQDLFQDVHDARLLAWGKDFDRQKDFSPLPPGDIVVSWAGRSVELTYRSPFREEEGLSVSVTSTTDMHGNFGTAIVKVEALNEKHLLRLLKATETIEEKADETPLNER